MRGLPCGHGRPGHASVLELPRPQLPQPCGYLLPPRLPLLHASSFICFSHAPPQIPRPPAHLPACLPTRLIACLLQLDTDINSLPTPAEMRPAWGGAAAEAVDIDVGPLFFGGATAAPAAQAHPPHPPFQSGISAGVGGGSSAAVPSAASGGLHPPPSGTMVFVPGVPDGNSVQGPSARDALAGGFGSVLLAGSASSPIALAGSASSSLAGVGSGGSELAPRDNALGPASPPGQPLLHGGRPHSASHPRAAGQGHHGLGAASSADNRRSLGQEERKGAAAQAGQGARDGKLAAVRRERSSLAEEAEVGGGGCSCASARSPTSEQSVSCTLMWLARTAHTASRWQPGALSRCRLPLTSFRHVIPLTMLLVLHPSFAAPGG